MKLLSKILVLVLFVVTFVETNAQVAVVANKNVSINEIDISTLKNLYEINSNELNGNKVTLFSLDSDDQTRDQFYSALGTSFTKVKKVWLRAKLTGNGNLPKAISADEMLNKIASTNGTIGFVPADKVNDKVKVLLQLN